MCFKGKFLMVSLLISLGLMAQTETNGFFDYSSIGLQYYLGTSIGKTYGRIRDSRPYSMEVYYQRQINVSPVWNRAQRLPQWGIALSATHTGSQYIGSIVCLYPFLKLPLFTAAFFQSDLRFGFGAGWVQKPYDKINNPQNELLSQRISTHVNLSWQNAFRLTPHSFINTAISFYHLSNAKTSLPNLGINIPSISIGYRYAFHPEIKKPQQVFDSLNKKMFVKIFLTGGVKQMQVPDSSYYFVQVLAAEVGKQISYSSTLALGLFITHDNSVKTDPLVTHLRGIPTSQIALYGSYEYNIGRLSIPVQLGVFLYNSNSNLVESVGFRYQLNSRLIAELMLKAHGHKADLMHIGMGYQL